MPFEDVNDADADAAARPRRLNEATAGGRGGANASAIIDATETTGGELLLDGDCDRRTAIRPIAVAAVLLLAAVEDDEGAGLHAELVVRGLILLGDDAVMFIIMVAVGYLGRREDEHVVFLMIDGLFWMTMRLLTERVIILMTTNCVTLVGDGRSCVDSSSKIAKINIQIWWRN